MTNPIVTKAVARALKASLLEQAANSSAIIDCEALANAAILAMSEAAGPRVGWQPIESAPKDGVWVYTWSAEDDHGMGRYFDYPGMSEEDRWSRATHWQPLPAPPTDSFGDAKGLAPPAHS